MDGAVAGQRPVGRGAQGHGHELRRHAVERRDGAGAGLRRAEHEEAALRGVRVEAVTLQIARRGGDCQGRPAGE
ncbi:hypothetical protein, partial [Clavibacter michiganensis]|uniref:hypothetical protein n=1 Tax=Clavibacter michiganensis TaxID=28447 RepID=UPI00292FDAF8